MATHGAPITTATAGSSAPTLSKVFPTALSASKAAGISAIRISQFNGDVLLEELNAKQDTIIGFRLHALVNSAKKITAVAVTQMGSGASPLPFTPAQRSAFGEIANELKQFKASNMVTPSAPTQRQGIQERSVSGWIKSMLIAVDVGISCGLSAVELGLNPIADVGCVAAATLADMDIREGDDSSSAGTGSGSQADADDSGGGGGADGVGDGGGSGGGGGSDGGGFGGWGGGEGDPLRGVTTTHKEN
jgi:uncharacterized membrane protein YgcG